MKRISALCVFVAVLPFSAVAEPMTGAQLTDLLSGGATLTLGGPDAGYVGSLVLSADGTGVGEATMDSGDKITIEGTWAVKGDEFCRTWKGMGDGEVCEVWNLTSERSVDVLVNGEKIGVNSW